MRTDEQYANYDPFQGDRDVYIEFRRIKIATTRKPHKCMAAFLSYEPMDLKEHDIPAGARAWQERGKVDGMVGTCYCCLPCLDRLMDQEEALRQ
jgi:hypothetical protein